MTARERYTELHKLDFQTKYPTAYKDGHYSAPKFPNIKETNGITTFIINFINWSGGLAERTGMEGRVIRKKGFKTQDGRVCEDKMIRVKNSGKGRSDISVLWQSKTMRIEVKNANTKDKLSEKQREYGAKVTKAGGLYFIADSVDSFLAFWDKTVIQQSIF